MPLFGPPNVNKLAAKRDLAGLIKALGYQQDVGVRIGAVEALKGLGDAGAVEPLIVALQDEDRKCAARRCMRSKGWVMRGRSSR